MSKDEVGNRFTAKDLLGASVYDASGERIGDIADIDLRGAVPGSLLMSFTQGQGDRTSSSSASGMNSSGTSQYGSTAGQSGTYAGSGSSQAGSGSTRSSGSTTGTGSSTGSGSMAGSSTGSTAGQSGTYASGTGSAGSNHSTSGNMASSATDALRDSSRAALSSLDSSLSGATVFVSVGGLFGIGDDLVSVPISMLSYNTSKSHFELAASKAEVTALTQGADRNSGYASSSRSNDSASSMSGTAAGKQSFGDEVSRVQSALRTDPKTSPFAHNVIVSSDGDTLELRGTVDSKEQKQQIVDCARRATSLKIDDDALDVRK